MSEQAFVDFFKAADTDKSGCLSPSEMRKVLEGLGCSDTKVIADIIEDIDKDGDDNISYEEFISEMGKKDKKTLTECEWRATFKKFDKDGQGTISKDEVKEMMSQCGDVKMSDEAIDDAFSEMDTSDDGSVTFEEFLAFFKR